MPWRATMAEMLACSIDRNQMDMTVLEGQQMCLRSQQQQQQVVSSSGCGAGSDPFALDLQQLMQMEAWRGAMLQYPFLGAPEEHHSLGFAVGRTAAAAVNGSSMATNCTAACPPSAEYAGSGGLRKRKAEDPRLQQSPLVVGNVDGGSRRDSSVGDKRVKSEGAGVELHHPKQEMQPDSASYSSKGGRTATTTSGDNSRPASEVVQKPDYVHVRARRGQATDSHSLAERARREKISERMKYLQDLVPGCNKIAGKAGMLDEIINYVQSLQRQIEFLSMKLAAANPVLDFAALEFSMINKEKKDELQSMSACAGGIPVAMVMPPDPMISPCVSPTLMTPQTTAAHGGLGLALNLQEIMLSGTSGDPVVPLSDFDMDASSFNVAAGGSSPAWDASMQSLLFAGMNQAVTSSIGKLYQNAT